MSSTPTQHQGWLHVQETWRYRQGRHAASDKDEDVQDGEAARQVTWRRRYVLLNDLGVFIFRVPPLLAVDCELLGSLPLQDIVLTDALGAADDLATPGACPTAHSKTGPAHGILQSHTDFQLRGNLVCDVTSGDRENTPLSFPSLLPPSSPLSPAGRSQIPEASGALGSRSVLLLVRAESSASKQAWIEVCARVSVRACVSG
jgi:hypothetical protein